MNKQRPPTQAMFFDEPTPEEESKPVGVDDNHDPDVVVKTNNKPKQEEAGLTIGHVFRLPSNGQLGYPSEVAYRDMIVADEEFLASSTEDNYVQVMNGVFKSVLKDCEFYEEMSIQDRNVLMVQMWSHNYSPIKRLPFQCNNCGHKHDHVVDFTKVDITDIHPDFKGEYRQELSSGGFVTVRLNTVGDELAVAEYLKANKGTDYSGQFLMMVQSINMDVQFPTLAAKAEWVKNNITARERTKIKQFHVKIGGYGFPSIVDGECPKCKEGFKFEFPFQLQDFLRPTVEADINEFL